MKNRKERLELTSLILEAKDENLDKERFSQLDRMIARDPLAAEHYVELIAIYTALSQPGKALTSLIPLKGASESQLDFRFLKELAVYEKNGKVVEVERVKEKVEPVLTEEERQAKIRAFIAEQQAMEEQERLLEQLERRRIRQRELRRRKRIARARTFAAKVRKVSTLGVMAAMGMAIAYLLYLVLLPVPPASVATLTGGVDVKWADPEQPTDSDSLLQPGTMKLVEGYAQITFDGGAKVIIEAPVEIKLQNTARAYLQSGKMSATVPVEARGFTLNTPSASLVDLGTEFGVHVKEDGSSDIHVFKGKVSLLAGKIDDMIGKLFDTVEQIIEAGQAKRVLADSYKIQDIQFGGMAFVRNMPSPYIPSPYELAVRKSKPVVYWRFDRKDSEGVDNVVDPGRYRGRYSGAMVFDEFGLRNNALKLDYNRQGIVRAEDITFVPSAKNGWSIILWIRADTIQEGNICLNVTESDTGQVTYTRQISLERSGRLAIRVFMSPEEQDVPNLDRGRPLERTTLVSTTPALPGRWYHLAATLAPDGHIEMYIDGKLDASTAPNLKLVDNDSLSSNFVICLSSRDYGQTLWIDNDKPLGSIKGAVDEIALYDRALPAEEIKRLYISSDEQ